MTTELEKQFFDTFGIEPKTNREYGYKMAIYNEERTEEVKFYPQITDRQYLELICLLGYFEIVNKPNNSEELKNYILDWYLELDYSEIIELKHQVQAIFEGER